MVLPDPQLHCLSEGIKLSYLAAPPIPNPALPTLLLLHPLFTDGSFFEPQFADPILGGEAGEKWNIIAIDIHGHGDTRGRPEFTFWDNANDIALFLDDFKIRTIAVCGVSQGGFLGARLAMIRPDLVSRLVLAGSTLLPDSAEVGTGLATVFDGFPHVDELLAVVLQAGFGVDVRAANSSARDRAAGKKWVAVWKERYGAGHEKTSRMQGCLKQLLQRDDIVPRIEELETMVDVLHGENDGIYAVEAHAEGTKRLLEENEVLGSYRVLEGGPHYLTWSHWEELDKKLVEILNAQVEGMRLGYV